MYLQINPEWLIQADEHCKAYRLHMWMIHHIEVRKNGQWWTNRGERVK